MKLKDFRSESIDDDYLSSLETDAKTFFNYENEKSICPICKNEVVKLLHRVYCLTIKQCSCGFMGMFPRPREKDLRDFYEYGKSNKLWHDIMMETYDNRKNNYIKNILPLLKNIMGNVSSLVDVGCGEGIWLDAIHTRFPNINLFGIEPFSTKEPKNYTLIKEFMESYSGAQKFDVCTLLSVIEHVADPIKTLYSCKNLLNANGILFVIAPNVAGFDYAALPVEKRNWEAPQHINYFTLDSLKDIVKKCGFEIVEAGTFGVLDVEIVAKSVREGASTNNEFLDTLLLDKSTDENRKQLQRFISKNNLSGQTFIIGRTI